MLRGQTAKNGGTKNETSYGRNRYLDGGSTPARRCFYPKYRAVFTCSGVVDVPYRYGGQCYNSCRIIPKINKQVEAVITNYQILVKLLTTAVVLEYDQMIKSTPFVNAEAAALLITQASAFTDVLTPEEFNKAVKDADVQARCYMSRN
jgi:hypothetical protein